MSRRVDALSSLETLGQSRPMLGHEVHLWFSASLARRLTAAGVRHLADLARLANKRGTSWWRSVPRIGPKSAEIITRWLLQAWPAGEVRLLEPYVVAPSDLTRREAIRPIMLGPEMAYPVPLEHMRSISADVEQSDLVLVREWLSGKSPTGHTFKSYRREAERVLLWAARQRLRLADLDEQALKGYETFLADPAPASFWCGPASSRNLAHWRPFEGPLSSSSSAAALRVVLVLLRSLHKSGHLKRAPKAITRKAVPERPQTSEVQKEHIDNFLAWLGSAGSFQTDAARATALLIRDGFKLSGLPRLTCGDLLTEPAEVAAVGRSNDAGVPNQKASFEALSALRQHWATRQIDPAFSATLPALAPGIFPPTRRGRSKQQSETPQGYSASGLDQLLRTTWKAYCRSEGCELPPFTPKSIRTAT
ncbi:phage integrase family protein [Cupriavidus sp. YR651]|uniref:phage integrase family protein n=1 Tax=Cupriavidus sp. YR651 TaxID=1855315 RepID=UPI002101A32A|nr:phage integrase family protein [Cupriavidus sp. YR651]